MSRTGDDEVLRGISAGNYHRGGVRCLRLFDVTPAAVASLRDDVRLLRSRHRPSRADGEDHVTGWVGAQGRVEQYSLVTASGRYDDFSRDHDLSCFGKRFRAHAAHPGLGALLDSLPHLVNARIAVLSPGAELPPHEEHSVIRSRSGGIGVRARFHLPLVTNPDATLLLDGERFHLAAGGVFLVNHGCVHAARNTGRAERIHLMWDQLLTSEALEIMFGAGPPPAGLTRTSPQERSVTPVGREVTSSWRKLAGEVPETEAVGVQPLDPQ
jgi:hypothetical protein